VSIPKPGREELRPLSIPAVRNRVVGAAVKLVIEPVFEADLLPCSFGFRPKRSQHDALQVLIEQSWKGRRWALETDIANCFELPCPLRGRSRWMKRADDSGAARDADLLPWCL
jgi:retron-type reverse transcriptase